MPAKAETRCEGEWVTAYVPVSLADSREYKNALDAMIAIENEIYNTPEFFNWDLFDKEFIGCDKGGNVSFSATGKGDNTIRFKLNQCAFSRGFAVTGDGLFDTDADRWTFKVKVSGDQTGTLNYERDSNNYSVAGTLNGKPVNLQK